MQADAQRAAAGVGRGLARRRGHLTIRVALVTIPSSWARITPSVDPGRAPEVVGVDDQHPLAHREPQLPPAQLERLAEPVVGVLGRRPPVRDQPSHWSARCRRQRARSGVERARGRRSARRREAARGRRRRARSRSASAQPPTSAARSTSPGPIAGHLPVDRADARAGRRPARRARSTDRARRGRRSAAARRGARRPPRSPRARRPAPPRADRPTPTSARERALAPGPKPALESVEQVRVRGPHLVEPAREAGVEPAEPPRHLLPDRELADLPELHARHLLEQQPVAGRRPPADGGEAARADPRRGEDAAVGLELALRLVQELRLRRARVAEQALPGEVLEDQRPTSAPSSVSDAQLLERGAGRVAVGPPREARRSRRPPSRSAKQRRSAPDRRRPRVTADSRSSSEPSTRSESRCSAASSRAAARWRS